MDRDVYRPLRIISGGQTGSDIGGLVGAEKAGFPTGGTAAHGFLTEKGPQVATLRDRFGLVECSAKGYPARTRINVVDADVTIIFSTNSKSAGTVQTVKFCHDNGKNYMILDPWAPSAHAYLVQFINEYTPRVINIAGNRESVSPGIASQVAKVLYSVYRKVPSTA